MLIVFTVKHCSFPGWRYMLYMTGVPQFSWQVILELTVIGSYRFNESQGQVIPRVLPTLLNSVKSRLLRCFSAWDVQAATTQLCANQQGRHFVFPIGLSKL